MSESSAVVEVGMTESNHVEADLGRQVNEQGSVKLIPVKNILITNLNPRKFFDPVEFQVLKDSISINGLLQGVLVRPAQSLNQGEAQYELVAGGRRFKAFSELYGQEAMIPAIVRCLTDEEVEYMASSENLVRADMTVTEESDSAARVLASFNGHKDEAAARLGWTRAKLEKRLALQTLIDPVKLALAERKITVGHAELLSAISQDKQVRALENIVARQISVADTKTMLMQLSQKLKSAIFDQTQCNGCPNNSSLQQSLLDTSVGDGFCTNASCFEQKTQAHLNSQVESLKEDYRLVHLVKKADGVAWTKISAITLGAEQVESCKSCARQGAMVSADPSSLGAVTQGVCFDLKCNEKMKAQYLESLNPSVKPDEQQENASANEAASDQSAASSQASNPDSKPKDASKKAPVEPKAMFLAGRVVDHRNLVWRRTVAKHLSKDPVLSRSVLTMMVLSGEVQNIGADALMKNLPSVFRGSVGKGLELPTKDSSYRLRTDSALGFALSAEQSEIDTAIALSVAASMKAVGKEFFKNLVDLLAIDLASYWKIDKEFLALLTKNELVSLLTEVGFVQGVGEDVFKKAAAGKRDEFLKFIEDSRFDFGGKVPSFMLSL